MGISGGDLYVVSIEVSIPDGHTVAPPGFPGAFVLVFVPAWSASEASRLAREALEEDGYVVLHEEYSTSCDELDWEGTADYELHADAREEARRTGRIAYGKFYAYADR